VKNKILTNSTKPPNNQPPRPNTLRHHSENECHELFKANSSRWRLFSSISVGNIDVNSDRFEDFAPFISADRQQPRLILGQAIGDVQNRRLILKTFAERLGLFYSFTHRRQYVRWCKQSVRCFVFLLKIKSHVDFMKFVAAKTKYFVKFNKTCPLNK